MGQFGKIIRTAFQAWYVGIDAAGGVIDLMVDAGSGLSDGGRFSGLQKLRVDACHSGLKSLTIEGEATVLLHKSSTLLKLLSDSRSEQFLRSRTELTLDMTIDEIDDF